MRMRSDAQVPVGGGEARRAYRPWVIKAARTCPFGSRKLSNARRPGVANGYVALSEGYCSGGRYWVRTSDLFGVNEARYHCANRPRCPTIAETSELTHIGAGLAHGVARFAWPIASLLRLHAHQGSQRLAERMRTWLSW